MSRRCVMSIVVCLCFWSIGSPSLADSKTNAAAKAAIDRAKEQYGNSEFIEAAESFREAMRLRPSWKIYYNIGQSEAAGKRYGLALDAFEKYLAEGGDEIDADRLEDVLEEVRRFRDMVGHLEIDGQEGDEVYVDGKLRGKYPDTAKIRLVMGTVQVQVKNAGTTITEREVEILGGETTPFVVRKDTEEEGGPVEEDVSDGEDVKRLWTWVAFSIGGAAAATAVVTGIVATSKKNRILDNCDDDNNCPTKYSDDFDAVKNLSITTDVMIGVAVAGVATGVLFYFFEPEWFSDSGLEVNAGLSPQGGHFSLIGRF